MFIFYHEQWSACNKQGGITAEAHSNGLLQLDGVETSTLETNHNKYIQTLTHPVDAYHERCK